LIRNINQEGCTAKPLHNALSDCEYLFTDNVSAYL